MILFCTVFLLTACSGREEPAEETGDLRIYCTDATHSQLLYEYVTLNGVTLDEKISEVIGLLSSSPSNTLYQKVKPDEVVITDHYFGADGQLILDFGQTYSEVSGVSEILMRAGIVRTLCQLDGIDYVEFYSMGAPLMLRSDTPLGEMTDTDFIDNTGGYSELNQKVYLTVYFATEQGDLMSESLLVVLNDGSSTMEELVLEQLINGPVEAEYGLYPVIPDGTVVNKVSTKDGICTVDLNEKFLEKRENVTEEIAIYSIVNSLCRLSNVQKVKITIDGAERKFYNSMHLSDLFDLRPELISSERVVNEQ